MRFTKAGALAFSQDEILGLPIEESTKLSILNISGQNNYFFPWNRYSLVQSGQKLIHSADNADTAMELSMWEAPEEQRALIKHLQQRGQYLRQTNLSRLTAIVKDNRKYFSMI